MPYTREACLRTLGLDPDTMHDAKDVTAAYRKMLFRYHPDSGGSAACPETLNRIIHANNMLSHTGEKAYGYSSRGAGSGGAGTSGYRAAGGRGAYAYGGARGDYFYERDPW